MVSLWLAFAATLVAGQLGTAQSLLDPTSRDPLNMELHNVSLTDAFRLLARATGIVINLSQDLRSTKTTASLKRVSLEEALEFLTKSANLAYKVIDSKTISVMPKESDVGRGADVRN